MSGEQKTEMRKLLTMPMMVGGCVVLLPLFFLYALFAASVGFMAMVLEVLTKEKNNNNKQKQ